MNKKNVVLIYLYIGTKSKQERMKYRYMSQHG